MPRYYEDKPEGGACAGVREDLGACLLQSRCVLQVARRAAAGRVGEASRRQHACLGYVINVDVSAAGASVPPVSNGRKRLWNAAFPQIQRAIRCVQLEIQF